MPSRRALLCEIFRVAFPVTISASVMSLVSLVDTVLISSRLQAGGFAPPLANAMYSSYGNLAVPLYNLVPALLSPITLSLTPTLTAAFAARDTEGAHVALTGALRLTALVALPAALGLSVFASPILSLLYSGQEAAVSVATPLLAVLAPAILPAVLIALTGAALQSAGKASVPVWSMLVGAMVKLLSEAVLLSLPTVNIMGAPISTLACNLTVLVINVAVLSRTVNLRALPIGTLTRPLFAAAAAVLAGGVAYALLVRFFGACAWQMPLVMLLVALVYLVLLLFVGGVVAQDIATLPGGKAICRVLLKYNLLKEVQKSDKRRKITVDFR
jgi:stage V sporulation protein B